MTVVSTNSSISLNCAPNRISLENSLLLYAKALINFSGRSFHNSSPLKYAATSKELQVLYFPGSVLEILGRKKLKRIQLLSIFLKCYQNHVKIFTYEIFHRKKEIFPLKIISIINCLKYHTILYKCY